MPGRSALVCCVAAVSAAHLLPLAAEARPARSDRDRAGLEAAATTPARKPDGPINIVVSIGSQRLWVYDKAGLIETSMVSTGVDGFPTPTGVFAVIDKEVQHDSNIYRGASMPFMQRLTMSGVALHSGATTGRPASHGCIRLPHAFAIKLFRLTGLGARVIIAPNEPVPQEIAHPRLFRYEPARPDPEEAGASALRRIATGSGIEMQKGVGDARVGKITAARARELQALPVSVFVSKAEGKVFVRHGFRQVLEAPAVIRDPERPIGTHVFTALEPKSDGAQMRWFALSVPASGRPVAAVRRVSRAARSEPEPALPLAAGAPSTPAEALDRIELPPEAVAFISAMVGPGASLIVSDHGHNREMRSNGTTDFIVLTR
jgi:hypothetical protein